MPVRPNVDGLLAQLGGTGAGAGGRGAAHGAAGASGGASQAAGAPRPTALARALSASGAPPEPVDTAAQSALARALRRTAELQSGEADTGPAAEPPAPQREFTLTGDVPAARLRLKPWLRRIGFVVLTGVLTVGGYLWVNAPPSAPHAPSPAPAQPATAAAPAPVAALAPAEPAPAPSVAPAPVSPTAAHYFVELITTPAGAQVVLGTQVVITPGVLDLGTLDEPTKLVAELAGHRAAQTVINRLGFEFDEGRWSRKVYLNLRPDPTAPPPAPLPTPGVVATTAAQPAPAVPTAPAPTPATAPAVAARPAAAAATSGQRASVAAPSPPVSVPPEQGVVITRVGRSAPATPPAAPAPAPGSEPSAAPAKKGPRTVAVPGTPAAAATDAGRLDKAMACLSQGDNACVISTLEGKARSPREFQLLIETYRSTGQQDAARANAERFLKLQPDAKEARRYAKLFGLALPE
jgi:hypothetical protein